MWRELEVDFLVVLWGVFLFRLMRSRLVCCGGGVSFVMAVLLVRLKVRVKGAASYTVRL